MISLTHLLAGLSIAYILDKRIVTASVFAVVPDFDVTFHFLYPFVHRGIMHTFLAAFVASFLVYIYSEDIESGKSCLIGYCSHLGLDTLTSSGVPLLFPLFSPIGFGITSASNLAWNTALISFFLGGMVIKKHSEIFSSVVRLR